MGKTRTASLFAPNGFLNCPAAWLQDHLCRGGTFHSGQAPSTLINQENPAALPTAPLFGAIFSVEAPSCQMTLAFENWQHLTSKRGHRCRNMTCTHSSVISQGSAPLALEVVDQGDGQRLGLLPSVGRRWECSCSWYRCTWLWSCFSWGTLGASLTNSLHIHTYYAHSILQHTSKYTF